MKRILFAILITISFFAQATPATEPKSGADAAASFNTSFANAQNVQWSTVENLFKVTFTLDEQAMFAFYNSDGELVVTGKYLCTRQLPKAAQKHLAEVAQGYKITEVFELNNGLDKKFYATLVNGSESKVMESNGVKWDTFKTNSK